MTKQMACLYERVAMCYAPDHVVGQLAHIQQNEQQIQILQYENRCMIKDLLAKPLPERKASAVFAQPYPPLPKG